MNAPIVLSTCFMNAFYEQMHRHTKLAPFSICPFHFTTFLCPLSLLVLAALYLRAGACRVLPKGCRGLGFAPIRGLGMGLGRWLGCRFGRGLRYGIHLHGGGLVGSFGLGLRGGTSLVDLLLAKCVLCRKPFPRPNICLLIKRVPFWMRC